MNASSFDVSKKFPTRYLTPTLQYKVSFIIMKLEGCEGWEDHPVHLKLVVPGQNPIERTEDLSKLPEKNWTMIEVGKFSTSISTTGDLEVSMYEDGSQSKKGIVVNKIIISSS